ncbi:MAG TPA: hypothetical protein VIJ62_00425 [Rhizomicrobium sp.]
MLICELEEPLDQALAFAHALALMGYGLRNAEDDYGSSFLAIAEAMTEELGAAKNTWRQIVAAARMRKVRTGRARRRVRRKQSLGI